MDACQTEKETQILLSDVSLNLAIERFIEQILGNEFLYFVAFVIFSLLLKTPAMNRSKFMNHTPLYQYRKRIHV